MLFSSAGNIWSSPWRFVQTAIRRGIGRASRIANTGCRVAGLQGARLDFKPTKIMPWAELAPTIAGLPMFATDEQAVTYFETGRKPDKKSSKPPRPQYRLDRADAEVSLTRKMMQTIKLGVHSGMTFEKGIFAIIRSLMYLDGMVLRCKPDAVLLRDRRRFIGEFEKLV